MLLCCSFEFFGRFLLLRLFVVDGSALQVTVKRPDAFVKPADGQDAVWCLLSIQGVWVIEMKSY